MIEVVLEFIKSQLKTNEFLSGGAVLMILGSLGGMIYRLGPIILDRLKKRYIVTLEIRNGRIFDAIELYLSDHNYIEKCKNLNVTINPILFDENENNAIFSTGLGNHFLKFKSKWFIITKSREEGRSPGTFRQYFSIKCFDRYPENMKNFLKEIINNYETQVRIRDRSVYYADKYGNWEKTGEFTPRKLSTVFLKDGLKNSLVEDFSTFRSNKQWYQDIGIPYRRGWLLYGPPGTGKSSIARALATEMECSLYIMNLSSSEFTDESLMRAVTTVTTGSIILIEDLDTSVPERNSEDSSGGISLGGLLNALDGAAAQEGKLVIITTNDIDAIDEALLRPGRVDLQVYLGFCDSEQVYQMCRNMFPKEEDEKHRIFADLIEQDTFTLAKIQQYLMLYRNSLEDAINNIQELK